MVLDARGGADLPSGRERESNAWSAPQSRASCSLLSATSTVRFCVSLPSFSPNMCWVAVAYMRAL